MSIPVQKHTQFLKEAALQHGFMGAGVSRAEYMDVEAQRLEQWLKKGYHGEMGYMANHFDMRVDPTRLVPGAKSVISLLYNYFPDESEAKAKAKAEAKEAETSHLPLNTLMLRPADAQPIATAQQPGTLLTTDNSQLTTDNSRLTLHDPFLTTHHSPLTTHHAPFKISRYAYGEDYHKVVRLKLKALVAELKKEIGDFNARVFVDSAPVMERDWAKRSGQGWIGKNTLLIHPKKGSYFFLAEIILDVEFEYDHPMRDHCGTCTKCIDACPTDAISPEGYVLDGSKCISYLTIELKSQIPESFKGQMEDWIYGCDICQEVCPWNRFSTPHHEPAFNMPVKLKEMHKEDWLELTEEVFYDLFTKSAVKRTGFENVKRNIRFLQRK